MNSLIFFRVLNKKDVKKILNENSFEYNKKNDEVY